MMTSCEVITEFAKTVENDGLADAQPDPEKYVKLENPEEVGEFLRYIQEQQAEYSEWIVLAQAEGVEPSSESSSADAAEVERLRTLHTSGNLERQLREMKEKTPPSLASPASTRSDAPPTLEPLANSDENWQQDWLLMDREAMQLQQARPAQPQCSFFHNWPSFRVADKLLVVAGASGAAFTVGFTFGVQAAINSIFRMLERPYVAGGAAIATALGAVFTPQVLLSAVGYIAIGGVVGGVGVAAPVLVVGSAGVFVAAGAYHGFIAAKRLVKGHDHADACCTENSNAQPHHSSPSSAPSFTIPLPSNIHIPHPSAPHFEQSIAHAFGRPPMSPCHHNQ